MHRAIFFGDILKINVANDPEIKFFQIFLDQVLDTNERENFVPRVLHFSCVCGEYAESV
jgi:hypothetical protein